jgi:hypothetical protein
MGAAKKQQDRSMSEICLIRCIADAASNTAESFTHCVKSAQGVNTVTPRSPHIPPTSSNLPAPRPSVCSPPSLPVAESPIRLLPLLLVASCVWLSRTQFFCATCSRSGLFCIVFVARFSMPRFVE